MPPQERFFDSSIIVLLGHWILGRHYHIHKVLIAVMEYKYITSPYQGAPFLMGALCNCLVGLPGCDRPAAIAPKQPPHGLGSAIHTNTCIHTQTHTCIFLSLEIYICARTEGGCAYNVCTTQFRYIPIERCDLDKYTCWRGWLWIQYVCVRYSIQNGFGWKLYRR